LLSTKSYRTQEYLKASRGAVCEAPTAKSSHDAGFSRNFGLRFVGLARTAFRSWYLGRGASAREGSGEVYERQGSNKKAALTDGYDKNLVAVCRL
jgi:hypothetical protein